MNHKLLIFNPSRGPRGGYVTVAWRPIYERTGFDPASLRLYQEPGRPLIYQIDQVDPDDPSRDTLSFFLSSPAAAGSEHYTRATAEVSVEGEPGGAAERVGPPEQRRVVSLHNNRMDVDLNLPPEADGVEGGWYAGSLRSVRLEKLRRDKHRLEYLDYPRAQWGMAEGHDPEKRCLQLESVELARADGDDGGGDGVAAERVSLFDRPYRLVSVCEGPVRKCVTIASPPFEYGPAPGAPPARCELLRVVSLYEDQENVFEELFLKVCAPGGGPADDVPDLRFRARYFTYMGLGEPVVCRYDNLPGWFAVGDLSHQLLFGFACDVNVDSVALPHPGFPEREEKTNTFSWDLRPCKEARCLHLFSRFSSADFPSGAGAYQGGAGEELSRQLVYWFESQAGHAWYEQIYKPLVARLAEPGERATPDYGASQGGDGVF